MTCENALDRDQFLKSSRVVQIASLLCRKLEGMVRISFAEELETAEHSLMAEGDVVRGQLERVLQALDQRDADLAERVIVGDDRVDDIYLAIETRIFNLLALQSPVARDLRLVSAIIHSNLHVERIGDLCVNIAKFVKDEQPYPPGSPMVTRLHEMGDRAAEMLDCALTAFAKRDADLAEDLPIKDNVLDRLNRGLLGELKQYANDQHSFEWATNLVLVARYLERIGDHTVDIGEQVSFVITGVFREFTDASHPDHETR
ncbi:phosphate signaling complex protein PhoU [soil metagenome]